MGWMINFILDYRCGGDDLWSEVYTFKTLRSGEDWSPHIALYGDMGTDGQSLSLLTSEALNGNFDVILHVGEHIFILFAPLGYSSVILNE